MHSMFQIPACMKSVSPPNIPPQTSRMLAGLAVCSLISACSSVRRPSVEFDHGLDIAQVTCVLEPARDRFHGNLILVRSRSNGEELHRELVAETRMTKELPARAG